MSKGQIVDWGCPDWHDKEAYPNKGEHLTSGEWRWQFIRRHPWYRELWNKLSRSVSLDPDEEYDECDDWRGLGGGDLSDEQIDSIWYLTNMQRMRNPCCSSPGENNHFARKKGGKEFRLPSRDYFVDKDMLERLAGKGKIGHIIRRFEYLLWCLENDGLLEDSDSEYAYIRFDLGRPIPPQIKSADKILKAKAELKRTPRLGGKDRENWPLYLRLIDAEDQEAKSMEIFKQIVAEGSGIFDNAANEASKIAGMIQSARDVQEKGSFFL